MTQCYLKKKPTRKHVTQKLSTTVHTTSIQRRCVPKHISMIVIYSIDSRVASPHLSDERFHVNVGNIINE